MAFFSILMLIETKIIHKTLCFRQRETCSYFKLAPDSWKFKYSLLLYVEIHNNFFLLIWWLHLQFLHYGSIARIKRAVLVSTFQIGIWFINGWCSSAYFQECHGNRSSKCYFSHFVTCSFHSVCIMWYGGR